MIQRKDITSRIFHVQSETQHELAVTFLRFQEHYESPEFRGRTFSSEEFIKWYIKNSPMGQETGEFTYYDDWIGFNVPSHILVPFYDGKFNPLSKLEENLLGLFQKEVHPYYIIGTFDSDNKQTIRHEVAHGLFYTNPAYKLEVCRVLAQIPAEQRERINHYLSSTAGYHPSVWEDETHAHLATSRNFLQKIIDNSPELRLTGKQLAEVLQKYYPTQLKP